jgi:hypothetical protein
MSDLSVNEQAMVRAILVAARVPRRDIDWMVESCPSIERARELYSRSYRQPPETPAHPVEFYDGVKAAGDNLVIARRSGDKDKESEAFSRLQTEIAIVYWRIEQEQAGVKLPPLPTATVAALEVLP